MQTQLPFAFKHLENFSPQAIQPTQGTAAARSILGTQPLPAVILLHGPAGAGKTHLLTLWQSLAPNPQCLLDDLEHLTPTQQIKAFHAFNHTLQQGGAVAAATRLLPAQLAILPDLKTRLLQGVVIPVQAPTDTDLHTLAKKWASDRQIQLSPEVITYLLTRAERSAPALMRLVAGLDTLSLAQKRAITIPLARQVLEHHT